MKNSIRKNMKELDIEADKKINEGHHGKFSKT